MNKLPSWKYPSSEEILNNPINHKKEVLQTIYEWKLSNRKLNNEIALINLINALSKIYNVQVNLKFNAKWAHFNQETNTIHLANKSILTALHEFAHKVYGSSEFKACRWSAWLFIKSFPERMRKMEWKGHLLIAKKPYANK